VAVNNAAVQLTTQIRNAAPGITPNVFYEWQIRNRPWNSTLLSSSPKYILLETTIEGTFSYYVPFLRNDNTYGAYRILLASSVKAASR
jgi:hypothetical protein